MFAIRRGDGQEGPGVRTQLTVTVSLLEIAVKDRIARQSDNTDYKIRLRDLKI